VEVHEEKLAGLVEMARMFGELLIGLSTTSCVLGLQVKRSPADPNSEFALKVMTSGFVSHVTLAVLREEFCKITEV